MKQVLIAHQSTIPHYRVPFYCALERLRSPDWRFDVVYDPSELTEKRFFTEQPAQADFAFSTLNVRTHLVSVGGRKVAYQNFLRAASRYDLIVVENAVNNLAYVLSRLHRLRGAKLAYWGHDRHIKAGPAPTGLKALSERWKRHLVRHSAGFFAYTEEMRERMVADGLPAARVFAVNNTIDILAQRRAFDDAMRRRSQIRQELALAERKTLLFVGRFTSNKRIPLLLEAYARLRASDPTYELLLVGGGGEPYLADNPAGVRYFGAITEVAELAPLYVAADLFAFPGAVGLGPLQALCYDLPVVTIDSDVQMPEFAYLNPNNSVVLPAQTTAEQYAATVAVFFDQPERLHHLRSQVWPSIGHLTVENMARRFAHGVEVILGLDDGRNADDHVSA